MGRITELKKLIDELSAKLTEMERNNEALVDQIERLTQDNISLEDRIAELEEDGKDLLARNAEQAERIETLIAINEESEATIAELEEENDELTRQSDEYWMEAGVEEVSFEQMIAFLREQRTSATALVINRLIEELAAANKVKNMFVKRQACVMLAEWAIANEVPLDVPAFFWEWTE